MTQKTDQRIGALDIYRYLTVTVAIISHVILHHKLYGAELTNVTAVAKSITRLGTPSLVILFGMMAEIVYVRKLKSAPSRAFGTILHRILLCYLCFIGIAIGVFFFDGMNFLKLIGSIPLISPAENGNIFKIFLLLLVMIIPLIWVRNAFGAFGLLGLMILSWGFPMLFLWDAPAAPYPFQHIGGLLFGLGDTYGPSALHSLGLAAFGALLANVFFVSDKLPWGRSVFGGVVLTAIMFLGYQIAMHGFFGVAHRIADYHFWRGTNHLGYYAYGMLISVAVLMLCFLLSHFISAPAQKLVTKIGGATLTYFFSANLALSIIPPFSPVGWPAALLLILTYVLAFSSLTWLWVEFGRDAPLIANFNRRVPEIASQFIQRRLYRG